MVEDASDDAAHERPDDVVNLGGDSVTIESDDGTVTQRVPIFQGDAERMTFVEEVAAREPTADERWDDGVVGPMTDEQWESF